MFISAHNYMATYNHKQKPDKCYEIIPICILMRPLMSSLLFCKPLMKMVIMLNYKTAVKSFKSCCIKIVCDGNTDGVSAINSEDISEYKH
ncbi:Hypothetical predicted protein [Octopus vulgaris]|uniref:Uncharacterized protein n=1 Tax=Octopus vulgaris TaxID=6645 RepID=A0AA36BIB3_OCTVU|nr:Hypothetical predicted protein [Octopus vulgaris]